jgi:hypothetical protein
VYGNTAHSAAFVQLLESLGQEVMLRNYKEFAGGLDTSAAAWSGERSYACKTYDGVPIMLHVASLLPLDPVGASWV